MKGIYAIANKISGQVYVGSAVDIGKRWKQHKRHLDDGTHHSKNLQAHWHKYGSENFEFKVLEHVYDDSNTSLTSREQHWIDELNSYHNGYNSTLIASRPFTFTDGERKRKEEQRNFEHYYGIPTEPKYVEKMRERPLEYGQLEQDQWEEENLERVENLEEQVRVLSKRISTDQKLGWLLPPVRFLFS